MDQALAPLSTGMGFLNLHWILQGVDAMLAAHADLQRLLLEALGMPGKRDRILVSVFVDDNARQLETINAVRKGMSVAAQHKMRIKYALNLVKSAAISKELEVARAKIYLEEVIGEIERSSEVKNTHTGSWPLDQDSHHYRKLKLEKKSNISTIASKAIEANLVSSLVLGALLAALDCSAGLSITTAIPIPKNLSGGFPSLWEELKEEAEARRGNRCSSAFLEGICSCLGQIAALLDSLLRNKATRDDDELQIKQLLRLAHKKLDYLDSGFQILEEQMGDLFSKMVANRKEILSIA
ncbi:hypothetical protein SELMODRAFT_422297 [Selaginella moellendorffii]|uniref:Uncharacterized protein n=1 Tax=Selaginella moellendorffii TaxID=88036 RepID=D8SHZ1_SELML|nr:uncharacterized protein LOC9654183 [Selaginella moellendorffii]EFJ15777.1 hypothetical protein SELMODRAFT_422297 [Selaginella moellendorffii]|eukprot:XP_002982968.1 uncharacterized protein LOC9654183 [Selaginella moellendorffii]